MTYKSGEKPGNGKYSCILCQAEIALLEDGSLPICPVCGFTEFEKED